MEMNVSVARELGQALGSLYQWNSAADVECCQALLCIEAMADSNGYAQLADVRREVGMTPDRMTRCIRLLSGYRKSMSVLSFGGSDRHPLIDVTTYSESPSVKRAALTPIGRSVVQTILEPILERERKLNEAEAQENETARAKKTLEQMGLNHEYLAQSHGENQVFTLRANKILKAVVRDLATLSVDELHDLGLPNLNKMLLNHGLRPDTTGKVKAEIERQLGISFALLGHATTEKEVSQAREPGGD